MTLAEKYAETKPVAVFCESNWGGLMILDIIHGIEDYVITCYDFGNGRNHYGKHKIESTAKGKPFFRKLGNRYYIDDCMSI